ncbi:hypothetical protein B0H34DRAFT_736439 [Crassisporium funariophilum]|nr:hypothetical protein B0H34DRAFT_736439 [Crassisporium funariophilum]
MASTSLLTQVDDKKIFDVNQCDFPGIKDCPRSCTVRSEEAIFNISILRASLILEQHLDSKIDLRNLNARRAVTTLPVELLCDIFTKYIEDETEHRDYNAAKKPLVSMKTRADPTILGQVCSVWRETALSFPMLWSTIYVLDPKPSQMFLTRLWLERAGTCPLNLSIEESRSYRYREDANVINELLSLFIARIQHWRAVDFWLPAVCLSSLMTIASQPYKCEKLESASLFVLAPRIMNADVEPKGAGRPSIDVVWRALHSSPLLRRVDWYQAYHTDLPSHAPWGQLTHVDLDFEFDIKTLLGILALCLRVQDVHVNKLSIATKQTSIQHCETIVLSSLHTLSLTTTIEIPQFFQQLTLPSLRTFDLYNQFHEKTPQDYVSVDGLIGLSNCSLERFILNDCYTSEYLLLSCLASGGLQNLTTLSITAQVSDQIIRALAYQMPNGQHEIMPFLKELSVMSTCRTTDGLLSQMVQSRWSTTPWNDSSCRTLKTVWLRFDGKYGLQDDFLLSRMFKAGLKGGK